MDVNALAGSPALAALRTLAAPSPDAAAPPPADLAPAAPAVEAASVGAGAGPYAVSQGIGHALSAADAASSAGHTVLGLLARMREAAGQAGDAALSSGERQALDDRFQASKAAIAPAVRSASVGGVNLVDGSAGAGLKVALGDGASASLPALDLTATGSTLALAGTGLSTAGDAATSEGRVTDAASAAAAAVAGLDTHAGALATHAALVQSSASATPEAADADGARLLALQVSQQLSNAGAAIANAAPQQLLALFRS